MMLLEQLQHSGLLLASHNKGKLSEIADLLSPLGISVIPAAERGVEEPEETGQSFAENARLKSLHSARETGLPALSDDSGLSIDALDGAPGIYSARWAGPEKDFSSAMEKIHRELQAKNITERAWRAQFVCVLSLAWPEGTTREFEGHVYGKLVWPPRGGQGFGYDPMFMPEGHSRTFGEMTLAEKHAISHRAAAFKKFVAALQQPQEKRA